MQPAFVSEVVSVFILFSNLKVLGESASLSGFPTGISVLTAIAYDWTVQVILTSHQLATFIKVSPSS